MPARRGSTDQSGGARRRGALPAAARCVAAPVLLLILIAVAVGGCTIPIGRSADGEPVSVTFGSTAGGSASAGPAEGQRTQAELRGMIHRFTLQFTTVIEEELDALKRSSPTAEERLQWQEQKAAVTAALVQIALGPSPEINLLDMTVLTALIRWRVESYWVPEVLGARGEPFLKRLRELDEEIWDTVALFLDGGQIADLRGLLEAWKQKNPGSLNIYNARLETLTEFAGYEGAERIQPSGLLPEISAASRSVDQVRQTVERAVFLTSVMPALLRNEIESVGYEWSAQPETQRLIADTDRFIRQAEILNTTIAGLPAVIEAERLAAIDQVMERLAVERTAALEEVAGRWRVERRDLFDQLAAADSQLQGLLGGVRDTLAAGSDVATEVQAAAGGLDALAVRLGIDEESDRPFDIREYQATVESLSEAARALTALVAAVDQATSDAGAVTTPRFGRLVEPVVGGLERTLWLAAALAAGLIVLFLGGLFVVLRAARRPGP